MASLATTDPKLTSIPVPTGDNTFVNPEDGTTLVFDTTKKKAISFVIFGKVVFKKVK